MRALKLPLIISILLLAAGLTYILQARWFYPVKSFVRSALMPLSQSIFTVAANGRRSDANRELSARADACRVETSETETLREENTRLRELLNFLSAGKYKSVGAEIVGLGADPLRETITINRGAESGIAVGYPVIARAGYLIGKVLRAESDIAVIQLLSDHQSRVAATIKNNVKSAGIIEGGYGVSVRMNLIPQNEEVKVGDIVVTSGLEQSIPYGLLIGTIQVLEKEAYQPFQRAILTPFVDGRRERLISALIPS